MAAALAFAHEGDIVVVWKLDRLGRSLPHLIEAVNTLKARGVGFRSLTEAVDTSTLGGRLIFHIFGALGQFERGLIRERTRAGLDAAVARGRTGGRKFKMTAAKLRLAMAAMGKPETKVRELGITRQTLYRQIGPDGSLREDGRKLLDRHHG